MSESRSGEFFLSEFSPRQLQHLQHFLSDNDLFTSKVEPVQNDNDQSISTTCQKEEQVRRLVEAAFIADYLQMPKFKSKLQTLFQYLLQSIMQYQSPCVSRLHECDTFTDMIPILTDNRLKCLRRPLIQFINRYPTVLLDSKFVCLDISQPYLITSVLQALSSDKIFLSSEDEILNSACDWLQRSLTPQKRSRGEDSPIGEILICLLQSIRPGLLSPSGLRNLVSLLDEYPQIVSADVTLNNLLSSLRMLLSHRFRSHFQAALESVSFSLDSSAFRSRADTPTLILVARQNSPSSFILYFLNLLSGQVLSSSAPLSVERTLLFEPSESNPIHLCTAEAPNRQNLVFLFIHQINTATLKGMIWDLATLQAEWMPDLDLKHASFAWATTSFSTFSLPHAVGVVYTADGLMVYCSFSLCTQTVLCVYRFDASSWSWIKYHPKAIEQHGGHKVLKPMPHATTQGMGERWLYGTVDSAEGSQFVRMRPAAPPGSGDYSIQVQTLPSPDFILRAYNLVSVHAASSWCDNGGVANTESEGETGENAISSPPLATFTFPFNACQRDSQAMRMCYSQPHNIWNSWEPTCAPASSDTTSSTSPTTSSVASSTETPLRFALSRNHIGFRGVVCTSSLSIPRVVPRTEDSVDNPDIDIDLEEETIDSEDQVPSLAPGSYFVMAGRLSQSILPPSPKVSGLWLLDPWAPQPASDVRDPTFALPVDLDGLLHRATAVCGSVALTNWTGLQAAAGYGYFYQETPARQIPQSFAIPPIMRFAHCVVPEPIIGDGSVGSGLFDVATTAASSGAVSLFAFHHHRRHGGSSSGVIGDGAGSDSD
ncbi:hypothetical protein Aperf_G00000126962 [Anoplocephala perfoliata]